MARKKKDAVPQDEETKKTLDELKKWQAKVARAKEVRQQWQSDYNVEDGENAFLNKKDGKRALVNLIAATIKTERPNLFFQSPTFYVRPKPGRLMPAAEKSTRVGEGVMSAIATQDDHLEVSGQLALLQSFFRIGVLKIIYDPRMEPNPGSGDIIYMTGPGGEPMIGPDQQPIPMKNPLTGEVLTEPAEVLTDEAYRWTWVDAASMLLPDEGPDHLRWTWIGEEVVVTLDEAKKDERFANRESLVANRTSSKLRDGQRTKRRPADDEEELFEYCEVYDIRNKRLYIWADGQDNEGFLHNQMIPKWLDNDPYALLFLGEKILGPEPNPWPVPVVRDWLRISDEYNVRREQITEGAKRSARKILFEDGAFPDEEEARKALQSSNDMESVRVNADGIKRVLPVVDPGMTATILQDIPLLLNDFRMNAGSTGARQANPEADTATEATLVERAANLRESDMQEAVIRWMSAAGRKMFQCIKGTLTLGMWISIREMDDEELVKYATTVYQIPPEMIVMLPMLKDLVRARVGHQQWLQVTREQLQFEADISMVPGSARPANLDMERRQWLQFLQIIGAAPQLLMSRELLRYTAERFSIHDDRLLDELQAVAMKMMAATANQAGRNQGSTSGGGAGTTANGAVMSAVTGGAR